MVGIQPRSTNIVRPCAVHREMKSVELRLARLLMKTGALVEARSVLSHALTEHPDNADLHFESAKLSEKENEPEAAEKELHRAIALQPQSAEFHVEESHVLRTLGRNADQQATLETALKLDPDSVEARYAWAALLKEEGDGEAAKAEYIKVRQLLQHAANRDVARRRPPGRSPSGTTG